MKVEVSLGKKEETKIHRSYQPLISDHQSWGFFNYPVHWSLKNPPWIKKYLSHNPLDVRRQQVDHSED